MKKHLLKGSAAALALSCLLGTVSAMPVSAAGAIFEDGFESGDGSWGGRGGAKVEVSSNKPYSGSNALYVSGRIDGFGLHMGRFPELSGHLRILYAALRRV